jgi:exoribonuclease-2
VIRDDLARLDRLPLVVKAPSLPPLPPETAVRFRLSGIDLLSLELHAEYVGTAETASVESGNP